MTSPTLYPNSKDPDRFEDAVQLAHSSHTALFTVMGEIVADQFSQIQKHSFFAIRVGSLLKIVTAIATS